MACCPHEKRRLVKPNGEISKEIIQSGHWLTLQRDYVPYKFFGIDEFLAMLGTVGEILLLLPAPVRYGTSFNFCGVLKKEEAHLGRHRS